MNTCIEAGVPGGIRIDQLKVDIENLLGQSTITRLDLIDWCEKIETVTRELDNLYKVFERFMPHTTEGHCFDLDVLGDNALLSLIFNIQYTQIQFIGEIHKIKNRVMTILAKG